MDFEQEINLYYVKPLTGGHLSPYPNTKYRLGSLWGPYLEVAVRDLHFVTHLLEELHTSLVQEHTDEHPALAGCLQNVTEDLHIREHVHQDGQDLGQGRGVEYQKCQGHMLAGFGQTS